MAWRKASEVYFPGNAGGGVFSLMRDAIGIEMTETPLTWIASWMPLLSKSV